MPMPTRPERHYPGGKTTPTEYDPRWQSYTDLSQEQIAAFKAMPEYLIKYARQVRWQAEIAPLTLPSGIVVAMDGESQRKIAGLKQAFDNGALTGTVPFVSRSGVYRLDAKAVTELYNACVVKVQGTYATLAEVIEMADTGKIASAEQVDAAFAAD